MAETKPEPKAGDPCPQCGDEFVEHRAPTDAERKAAEDRESARPYPARVDTAPAAVRAELGPLLECRGCGYRTRLRPEPVDEPAKGRRKRADAAPVAAGASNE
jgi:hypothetical protein